MKTTVVPDDGLPLIARAEINDVRDVDHPAAHDVKDVESGPAGGSERAEDLEIGEEGNDEIENRFVAKRRAGGSFSLCLGGKWAPVEVEFMEVIRSEVVAHDVKQQRRFNVWELSTKRLTLRRC